MGSPIVAIAIGMLCLAGAGVRAQERFPPASFVNLQVLPKDSSPAKVVNVMKNFTRDLGVRCQHCHVGEEGMPLEKFDFASDTKAAKTAARVMLRLVVEINSTLDRDLPGSGKSGRVSCLTCHAGRATPRAQ